MTKKRKEIIINFSKISPNFILALVVFLSFLVGFLVGRIISRGVSISKSNNDKITQVNKNNQGNQPSGKKLSEIVKAIGVDEKRFKACLNSGKYKDKVNSQFNEGAKAGIRGTPGGVIFDLKTGKMKTLLGAVPYEELTRIFSELKKGNSDPQAPKVKRPDPKKDHWRGSRNARYVLVEYSDFECPFCDRFHPTAIRFLKENNDVAWVYRHFPLRSLHPNAQKLAEASECIIEQKGEDGFWNFADKVFEAMPGVSIDY